MRQSLGPSIPGEGSIFFRIFQERLQDLLDTLSEREAGMISMWFGIGYSEPKSLVEIAKFHGVSRNKIVDIERQAMRRLRHPSRSDLLRDYVKGVDFPSQWAVAVDDLIKRSLIDCPRHGFRGKASPEEAVCLACPCPVWSHSGAGRRKEYCTDACKQAAYRRRRRASVSHLSNAGQAS